MDKNYQKWSKLDQLVIIPYHFEKFFEFFDIYVVGQDDQPNDNVGQDDQLYDLVGHENRYPPNRALFETALTLMLTSTARYLMLIRKHSYNFKSIVTF